MTLRAFLLILANLVFALFLTSPFWIWEVLDPKSTAGISRRAGNNALAAEYIYDGRDIDVLFIGSSQLRSGIEHESLRESYHRATGNDIDTLTIGHNWDGLDLVYFKLRDFLEHNKANLVVVESPNYDPNDGNHPHPDTKFFFRIADDPEFFWGLPKTIALKLYAEQVLVAPRLLIGALLGETGRDAEHNRVARDRGSLLRKQGFNGASFERFEISKPCNLTVDNVLLPTDLPDDKLFGAPVQFWERHFLTAMDDLLRRHGTKAVFLRYPYMNFAGTGFVERNSDFPAFWDAYSLSNEQLFEDHPLETFYHDNSHLNMNGALRVGDCLGTVLADMEDRKIVSFGAQREADNWVGN